MGEAIAEEIFKIERNSVPEAAPPACPGIKNGCPSAI
jgi:hypothetical protein